MGINKTIYPNTFNYAMEQGDTEIAYYIWHELDDNQKRRVGREALYDFRAYMEDDYDEDLDKEIVEELTKRIKEIDRLEAKEKNENIKESN